MVAVHVQRWGQGPAVLLVHGSVFDGEMTWAEQRPLADRWTLLVPDRRGYWPNPPVEREDFEVDADDIAALLDAEGSSHLAGHSYGGVIALLAAARRITQPVLSVLGEQSNALWPCFGETHRLLLSWPPQAEGYVLPGATHFLQLQNPHDMAEALAALFARHPIPVAAS